MDHIDAAQEAAQDPALPHRPGDGQLRPQQFQQRPGQVVAGGQDQAAVVIQNNGVGDLPQQELAKKVVLGGEGAAGLAEQQGLVDGLPDAVISGEDQMRMVSQFKGCGIGYGVAEQGAALGM